MGGLAHHLEEEGLPTTQISLIREHAERIKPPRALWVPFELGRPLGVPGDAKFQARVLLAVLNLLDAPSGPVLSDFPDDAPAAEDGPTTLSCPVSFAGPVSDLSDVDDLRVAFRQEIGHLRPWYDLAVDKRGRTTLGVSGLDPDELGSFIGAFLDGTMPTSPRQDVPSAAMFKLAAEDLKAYYCEAVTAQPGQETPDSQALANWFWRETTAGKTLFAIQETHRKGGHGILQLVSERYLVPEANKADSS